MSTEHDTLVEIKTKMEILLPQVERMDGKIETLILNIAKMNGKVNHNAEFVKSHPITCEARKRINLLYWMVIGAIITGFANLIIKILA